MPGRFQRTQLWLINGTLTVRYQWGVLAKVSVVNLRQYLRSIPSLKLIHRYCCQLKAVSLDSYNSGGVLYVFGGIMLEKTGRLTSVEQD